MFAKELFVFCFQWLFLGENIYIYIKPYEITIDFKIAL
jgi:hypothetical protein